MPPARLAAPAALVLVPAQLAPRQRVGGAGRGLRGPIAVPVLALAVVALTWVDAGMLRGEDAHTRTAVDPTFGTGGDGTAPETTGAVLRGVVPRARVDNGAPDAADTASAHEPDQEN